MVLVFLILVNLLRFYNELLGYEVDELKLLVNGFIFGFRLGCVKFFFIYFFYNLIVYCEVLMGLLELEELVLFLFEVKDLDDMFLYLNWGWGLL